mgnify:CR=1 FL=1
MCGVTGKIAGSNPVGPVRCPSSNLLANIRIMTTEIILLIVSLAIALVAFLNGRKTKKRLDTLEIVLAKKNLLTWDDPAWKLNKDDQELLKELNK